ncbi:MAG: ECF transporter S component [Oscillospiraceae bacterium]|nr:ECF transporter S component [Oscillospiraceae bacterium]
MTSKKKSTLCTILCLCVLIPVTLILGSKLKGRWYYLTATLIVIEAMLPFFFAFEIRKPKAGELVTIGVMAALGAVSRGAFAFLPHFKPLVGIIMITGIAFGGEVGFLTGAIAAFASNFFFGQGPFTPWQMMSYGMGGFLAGLVFHNSWEKWEQKRLFPVILGIFGFLSVLVLVGPLLDICSLFTMSSQLSWSFALACLTSGFFINVTHGVSTLLTLLLLGKPLLGKLKRLRVKYGIWEQ